MEAQYSVIDKSGNKFYYKDREMRIPHRSDGPAIEFASGTKCWYIDGKLHRLEVSKLKIKK